MRIDVVYLNGGTGQRAKLGYPKQYANLAGKPILIYGLEVLQRIGEIDKIIIPTEPKEMGRVLKLCKDYNINKSIICDNGNTRQLSVKCGLKHVTTEFTLIAESVRPFMSEKLVKKVIETKYDMVIPIDKSIATVINFTGVTYEREIVGMVQMPQKFRSQLLIQIHAHMFEQGLVNFSDDAEMFYRYKYFQNDFNVYSKIFHGEEGNIKITTPLDLKIAEAIYKSKMGAGDE